MSVTYTDQIRPAADRLDSEAYVPVYARRSGRMSKKPVKTWMILAPLGVLVIGGAAAAMLMQPGEETVPVAIEAAPPAPLVAPEVSPEVTSLTAVPIAPAELTTATPAAPSVAASVERRAPPAPTAPARTPRAAPVEETEAPIVSTGPQPYLSVAPQDPVVTPPPAPVTPAAPPAPVIIVPTT